MISPFCSRPNAPECNAEPAHSDSARDAVSARSLRGCSWSLDTSTGPWTKSLTASNTSAWEGCAKRRGSASRDALGALTDDDFAVLACIGNFGEEEAARKACGEARLAQLHRQRTQPVPSHSSARLSNRDLEALAEVVADAIKSETRPLAQRNAALEARPTMRPDRRSDTPFRSPARRTRTTARQARRRFVRSERSDDNHLAAPATRHWMT
jgi:hypothetical protein